MARIDDIFKKEIRHADPQRKRKGKFRWVHYTKLHRNKDQYCDPTLDEIERLADLIDAEGEILQDLVIKKDGPDDYEIMAGHKRHLACKLLVENRGKKEYEFLPCYEINDSEVRSEFRVYSTNGYHEKTDYEKMHEIERMRALLIEHPEEFPNVQGGRMVERLAQVTAMKKTTVGEYLTISKNLGDKGMEMFKKGELKKSAAVALSGLSKDEQDKVIDEGITTHTDIKKYKKKIEKQEARKLEAPVKELKKPVEVDKEYLNAAARCLIKSWRTWFRQDYINRVMLVDKSRDEIKKKIDGKSRCWHFSTEKGVAHINLFDDYVQLWDEMHEYIGDFDWFYLIASIQSMWNVVAIEDTKKDHEKVVTTLQLEEADPELDINPPEEIATRKKAVEEVEAMKEELDRDGSIEHEQPELPHMKNNDERKEWLRNYKAWGIWYIDLNIGCTYYKYDFSNGASLIAETYRMPATSWCDAHEAYYLHLVGGPEAPQKGNGCGRKWQSHKVYTRHPDNETDLVEFLKYVQKG